ncbi:MAG: sugar phosphate nucleotidyltransferase, partial [Oscillospiraceae bacterium]
MQPIKTVIMAGGKGTRIAQDWPLLPKPMVPLCGKPILQHQIELLVRQGLCDITLVVGHMADKITAHFGDGAQYGARIGYVVEQAPLGTAGALALVPRQDILLLMGDVFLEVDFSRFLSWHREKQADITLFAHPNSHPWDSDLLVARPTGQVQRWASKKDAERGELRNLVNAGLYILSAHVLPTQAAPLDLDKGVVAPRIAGGGVYAYRSSEYVKDMGTPERLAAVCRDIENGVCAARALNNRQRAVFLDRDGVINRHEGFVTQPQQLALLPGAAEGIHRLNTSPFLAICVTNQPVVARGDVSFEGLEHIHA